MANLIDDTLNFGFGLFAYSREKIESLVEKMVDAGKIERRDAKDFARDMVSAGEEQRKEVKKMVRDEVRETLDDLGLNRHESEREPLTAEQIRRIVREELEANDKKSQA